MKTIIETKNAPSAIGPYSQAVLFNGVLYTSGQIAIDPKTNALLETDIQGETKMVMNNLSAVLSAAKMNFSHVIKTTIFLKDMDDFQAVNEIYATFFSDNFPARETVQVAKLPKDVKVEISMIASL
ncbi:RidA family protein [Crocinitomix catalasitica]|uniref:RidA family protein n=1 Tax=Crocinitomix catalasitica TaxID=184607 RepID=UPI0004869409|nr:RidA family protein [Crocinitomix catalasitica]|tara:strand:- start:526 stop:903 length:378 start_codon:yes stop_codon:yes gene_type:complete